MTKVKLDAAQCAAAVCPEGKARINLWDTVIPGFVLEVRASGGKTYYLRYFDANKRQRQIKLAVYGDVTFDQAKKQAQRLRSQVVLGGDPAADKEDALAIPLYADLAQQHLDYARTYQKSFSSTEMNMRVHILPRWGKVKLTDIKQQAVAAWLADKAGEGLKPATVEKIRVLFHRSFELAIRWNMYAVNPVKGIPRPQLNNARERYLTGREAKGLLLACQTSENPQLADIVGLLLLTGARVSELLHAKWEHVDVARKLWLIPTSKTGKHRYVPLSKPALDIIRNLQRFEGCPYLLPNPDTGKPFVSIKRAWQTARARAGLPDLHIHDLRHSAASFMINAGVDLYAVGKVLGHVDHKSTMRYAHLSDDSLLAAVEAGAKKQAETWM